MIDLDPKYLLIVNNILKAYVPECEVRAFGSRVTGRAKKYSDLDIVIIGKEAFDRKILYKLQDEFAESDLPFRVEILDWQVIPENFRRIINEKYEVIQC